MKIGVLGMQGDIEEHLAMLSKIGVEGVRVKSVKALDAVDGLIMPGGESTTMLKLLKLTGLFDILKEKIKKGFPVYGTCAGVILLAYEVSNPSQDSLRVLDVSVSRNGYGRQIDSFHAKIPLSILDGNFFDAFFIRAPIITRVGKAEVIAMYDGKAVFVRQGNIIGSTFHPELSEDTRIHEFFVRMVENAVSH